jgi:hypothetical protein
MLVNPLDSGWDLVYNYSMSSEEDPNPYGFLKSLPEGLEWITRLENELVELLNDVLNHKDVLTETSLNALYYSIAKTEEAIQRLEIEIKMFEE